MRWVLIALFIHAEVSWATTVLVPGPDAPLIEYNASLEAEPDAVSPVDVLLKQRPTAENREHLLARFASAQKLFLGASTDSAAQAFRVVVAMTTADDWGASEREILLASYLRLAQLTNKIEDFEGALSVLPGTALDRTLYPPPLLERLQRLRAQQTTRHLHVLNASGDWKVALINGLPCTREHCADFTPGKAKVRVTYLSDRYLPQTKIADGEAIETYRPERTPWLTGTCEHAEFHPGAHRLGYLKPFWALSCGAAPAKAPEVNLTSLKVTPVAAEVPEPTSRPFYRSKWFWFGLGGLVVTAVAIGATQKRSGHDEIETTQTHQ